MIKAIIFDLWETIGTKNIGISKTLRDHFKIKKIDDFTEQYERAIQLTAWKTQEEMAINFLKSFGLPATSENIQFVKETLQKGIDNATVFNGMDELLKSLKKKYKLGLLSNTTIFESEIPKKLNIHDLFDVQVYSWHLNSLKPAKKNFDKICCALNAEPSECVFIDDGEKNVLAARAYGFEAIKYENIAQLKKDLIYLGVVIDQITTIIFDFGGVISKHDPFPRVSAVFEKKFGINKDEFYRTLKANDEQYLLGNISTEEFWKTVCHNTKISYDEFEQEIAWYELNTDMVNLIRKLKQKFYLVILSDCYDAIYKNVLADKKLKGLFEQIFYSNTLHISKARQKEETFKFVLNKLQKSPSECIFIDDKEVHVQTAINVGIRAILFKTVEQLKKELTELGIDI